MKDFCQLSGKMLNHFPKNSENQLVSQLLPLEEN